ncbi:MAG: copper resistance CopC family protein [Micropepsaceae bacterium]
MNRLGKAAALAIVLCLAALSASEAFAHAALLHASPSAGQTLSVPPKGISIEFSTKVDLSKMELHVTAPSGTELALVAPELQTGMSTTVIRGFKSALAAGTYSVRWRVFSVDGHWTRGDYTFTVEG